MDEQRQAMSSLMAGYDQVTQRDLDQLNALHRLLGDPRQRVEVPHVVEGRPEPMPASTRYSAW